MNQIVYEVISQRVPKQLGAKVRKEGKHYVALSPVVGAFISMNQLAGIIYHKLDGQTTIGNIVDELVQRYKTVERDKIEEDVCKCISDLESFNLVTLAR